MPLPLVVVTRPLGHRDALPLRQAMREELAELYEGEPFQRSGLSADAFDPPDGRFLIGYVGTAPVAIGGYRKVTDELAQVHRVYVRPEARGHGHAGRVMARIESLAAAAGYRTLRLGTGVRQEAATSLYEGRGFERIPRFAPYEDDPLMRCYAKRIG